VEAIRAHTKPERNIASGSKYLGEIIMEEKPILSSALMVQGIIEGRTTQTRRVIKHKYPFHNAPTSWRPYDCEIDGSSAYVKMKFGFESEDEFVRCPYPKPGGCLWVRETWAELGWWDGDVPVHTIEDPNGLERHIIYYEECPGFEWRDDDGFQLLRKDGSEASCWKPSIFMPRWASRITLRIFEIRVERLQDITEEDAISEGSQIPCDQLPKSCQQGTMTERTQFSRIWDSINGKTYPWASNPWVWVIKFIRVLDN
jgi:hypothetical protein